MKAVRELFAGSLYQVLESLDSSAGEERGERATTKLVQREVCSGLYIVWVALRRSCLAWTLFMFIAKISTNRLPGKERILV